MASSLEGYRYHPKEKRCPVLSDYTASICVPFQEEEYTTILADRQAFRNHLQQTYQNHPQLFPDQMGQGFRFHGFVSSRKLNLDQRRIKLSNGHVYQIRPSFVMPYMIAKT